MFVTTTPIPESNETTIAQNQQNEGTLAGRPVSKWSCNPCLTAIKWVAVAALVAGAIVGAGGLLIHLGFVQLAIPGIGFISGSTGLFTAIAGLGTAAILTSLLSIKCCLDKLHEKRNPMLLQVNSEEPALV